MEFRLVYDGRLPAASRSDTRNQDKDRIRRELSAQLVELFNTHPALMKWFEKDATAESLGLRADSIPKWMVPGIEYSTIDLLAHKYERLGKQYFPFIDERLGIACSLDILFLRRDQPGNLIASGGDLDNRIKVLFDALRMPQNADEVLGRADGQPDTEPIFVLLKDDRLIVDVRVTTDRLLTRPGDGDHRNDVRLIIHVKTVVIDATQGASWLL